VRRVKNINTNTNHGTTIPLNQRTGRAISVNPIDPSAETDDLISYTALSSKLPTHFGENGRETSSLLSSSVRNGTQKNENLQTGDVVIVQDANQLRSTWTLGRISRAEPSSDGRVRKVDVQYKRENGNVFTTITRPVQRVVVIVPTED